MMKDEEYIQIYWDYHLPFHKPVSRALIWTKNCLKPTITDVVVMEQSC